MSWNSYNNRTRIYILKIIRLLEVISSLKKIMTILVVAFASAFFCSCGGKLDVPPDDVLYDQQKNLQAINIEAAWEAGITGKDVKIAVIDSGMMEHADLDSDRIEGKSYVSMDENDYSDENGHGTTIVGMLAAEYDNEKGISGMTQSDISVRKIFSANQHVSIDYFAQAIKDAVDDGCQVINISVGTPNRHKVLKEAIEYAAQKNVIVVAAAGGDKDTMYYPAAYKNVIGVAALDENKEPIEEAANNKSIYVTAPGTKIIGLSSFDGYTRDEKGASFAAVHVTAMAAFAKQVYPDMTVEHFKEIIQKCAVDLGKEGYDTRFGWGMVDVKSFVELLNDSQLWKS